MNEKMKALLSEIKIVIPLMILFIPGLTNLILFLNNLTNIDVLLLIVLSIAYSAPFYVCVLMLYDTRIPIPLLKELMEDTKAVMYSINVLVTYYLILILTYASSVIIATPFNIAYVYVVLIIFTLTVVILNRIYSLIVLNPIILKNYELIRKILSIVFSIAVFILLEFFLWAFVNSDFII